jgi:flagellar M-ring protein FliF
MDHDKYIFLDNKNAKDSFFDNPFEYISARWSKLAVIQKIIFIGIILSVIGCFVALVSVSASSASISPSMVAVIDAPILDEDVRNRIIMRINEEGYKTFVTANGIVMVDDKAIARKMRAILIQEDLIPKGTDPWKIFDKESRTISDFKWNVDFLKDLTQMIKDRMVRDCIRALDGVDDVDVSVVIPKNRFRLKDNLFIEDHQNPVSASVILIPTPGSDITENRKMIEDVQEILKYAVEGLKDENIVITDQNGLVLNNFEF